MSKGIYDTVKDGAVGVTRAVNGDEAAQHTGASWDALEHGDLATSTLESAEARGAGNAYWLRKLGFGGRRHAPEQGKPKSHGGIFNGLKNFDVGVVRAFNGEKAAEHEAASWDAFGRGDLATSSQESSIAKGEGDAYWLRKLGLGDGHQEHNKPKTR